MEMGTASACCKGEALGGFGKEKLKKGGGKGGAAKSGGEGGSTLMGGEGKALAHQNDQRGKREHANLTSDKHQRNASYACDCRAFEINPAHKGKEGKKKKRREDKETRKKIHITARWSRRWRKNDTLLQGDLVSKEGHHYKKTPHATRRGKGRPRWWLTASKNASERRRRELGNCGVFGETDLHWKPLPRGAKT